MRAKRLLLSPELFCEFFSAPDQKHMVTSEGFPEDARIVNARMDHVRNAIELVVVSGSFPELPPDTHVLPALWVTFTKRLREAE